MAKDTKEKNRDIWLYLLFMAGALLCGLSVRMGGFPILLIGRIIQAIGAGGMIPVANAEIGTSFPPEKRGFAGIFTCFYKSPESNNNDSKN